MKPYIDHYEIQAQGRDGTWDHIGNVYPNYDWAVRRPWYFLGLIRRPVIVGNTTMAADMTFLNLVSSIALMCLVTPGEAVRIVEWQRGWLGRLHSHVVWDFGENL